MILITCFSSLALLILTKICTKSFKNYNRMYITTLTTLYNEHVTRVLLMRIQLQNWNSSDSCLKNWGISQFSMHTIFLMHICILHGCTAHKFPQSVHTKPPSQTVWTVQADFYQGISHCMCHPYSKLLWCRVQSDKAAYVIFRVSDMTHPGIRVLTFSLRGKML